MVDATAHHTSEQAASGGTHLTRGCVAHRSRGRVRLRFNAGNRGKLPQIATELRAMPDVTGVEVHPETGSVIVRHKPGDPHFERRMADLVQNAGLFFLEGPDDPRKGTALLTEVEKDAAYLADHSKTGRVVLRSTEHVNRAVKAATNGWVDLRVLFPVTVGVAAIALVGVETAPLWVPLALFSFQSFANLHQPTHARPPLANGVPAIEGTSSSNPPELAPSVKALTKATGSRTKAVKLA